MERKRVKKKKKKKRKTQQLKRRKREPKHTLKKPPLLDNKNINYGSVWIELIVAENLKLKTEN